MSGGCAVLGCLNHNEKIGGSVTYHRFPQNNETRQKWLLKCGRATHLDCSRLRICSAHFSDDDFESNMEEQSLSLPIKRRLMKGIIPHKNIINVKEEPIDDEYQNQVENSNSNFLSSELQTLQYPNSESSQPKEKNNSDEHKIEQIGVLAANIQVPFTPNQSSSSHHVPSSLPASQNWPGKYEFTASFNSQEKQSKGISWTYSKLKDKLYVKKDASCPINFSANAVFPNDVVIRAMALYTSPEEVSEVVHRCVNHSLEDVHKGLVEAEHLIRCESKAASYVVDCATQRHSVVVPFENPPVGQQFSTYIYKFACFGSCSGGPNRRPLMIVFTLERNGQVLGRQKFDVKICACPGRDRSSEEYMLPPAKRSSLEQNDLSDCMNISNTYLEFTKNIAHPSPKRPKILPSKDGHYTITVDDIEQYEFLKQMKKLYEIDKNMKRYKKALAVRNQRKKEERNN